MKISETEELLFVVCAVWDVRVVERIKSSSLLAPLDSSVSCCFESLLVSSTGLSLIVRLEGSAVDGFEAAMIFAVVEAARPLRLNF